MAFTIDKILNDAHNLSTRLKEHDLSADSLISRTQTLLRQVEAMKQYQENLNELNEIARHRPRANLILSLAQENSQIRELQQENKELRESLEEHQTALELIMSKYREQVSKLLKADELERAYIAKKLDCSQEMQEKMDKIYEMAAVMWTAVKIDDGFVDHDQEIIARLEKENSSMRELLQISSCCSVLAATHVASEEKNTQTDVGLGDTLDFDDRHDLETSELSSLEEGRSLSSSVIVRTIDEPAAAAAHQATNGGGAERPEKASTENVLRDAAREAAELSAALQELDDVAEEFDVSSDSEP